MRRPSSNGIDDISGDGGGDIVHDRSHFKHNNILNNSKRRRRTTSSRTRMNRTRILSKSTSTSKYAPNKQLHRKMFASALRTTMSTSILMIMMIMMTTKLVIPVKMVQGVDAAAVDVARDDTASSTSTSNSTSSRPDGGGSGVGGNRGEEENNESNDSSSNNNNNNSSHGIGNGGGGIGITTVLMTSSDPNNSTKSIEFETKIFQSSLSSSSSDGESPTILKIGMLNSQWPFYDSVETGYKHACTRFGRTAKRMFIDADSYSSTNLQLECYYARMPTRSFFQRQRVSVRPCEYQQLLLEEWVNNHGIQSIALAPSACGGGSGRSGNGGGGGDSGSGSGGGRDNRRRRTTEGQEEDDEDNNEDEHYNALYAPNDVASYVSYLESIGIPVIAFSRDIPPPSPTTSSLQVTSTMSSTTTAGGQGNNNNDEDDENENIYQRTAFVGVDAKFMGRTLARLLKQLRPEGGRVGVVSKSKDRTEGFLTEITKDNDRDDRAHWHFVDVERLQQQQHRRTHQQHQQQTAQSDSTGGDGADEYISHLREFITKDNVDAVVMLTQLPMRASNWTDFVDAHRVNGNGEHVTFLGVDGDSYQLDYLNQKYVDGLVGQLPWDIGSTIIDVMVQAVEKRTKSQTARFDDDFFSTNLVAYNLIPLELPTLDVDQNLLGNLKILGFVCFGIVALCSIISIGWTVKYHLYSSSLVVAAAQPFFLIMLAIGVLVMSSTLIPLSWDDNGQAVPERTARAVCQSIPWLSFVGFSITFGALFSKTWRINRLVSRSASFGKTRVTARDVLGPFAAVLLLNVTILSIWTAVDPMSYTREFSDGTDFWNREIESIGRCKSEHASAFLIPLALVNFTLVVIACWQAWTARNVKSEFSESKYIGLAVFSLAQAFLTGIPIVAIVRDIPQAFYLVLTLLVFILSIVTLLLIFMPKVLMQRKYSALSRADQKKLMALAISVRRSQGSSDMSPSGDLFGSSTKFGPQYRRISGLHIDSNIMGYISSHAGDGGSSNSFRVPNGVHSNPNRSSHGHALAVNTQSSNHRQRCSVEASQSTGIESSSSRVNADDLVMTSIDETKESLPPPILESHPSNDLTVASLASGTGTVNGDVCCSEDVTDDSTEQEQVIPNGDEVEKQETRDGVCAHETATILFQKIILFHQPVQDDQTVTSLTQNAFRDFLRQVDRSALASDAERDMLTAALKMTGES